MSFTHNIKSKVLRFFSKEKKLTKPLRRKRSTSPVDKLLYNHQVLIWEEDKINSLISRKLIHHWFFHSITFEFEENNIIYLGMITRFGGVMSLQFKLEDVWCDDYTSYFQIKLDISSIETDSFIINSILHLVIGWLLSFFGTFFNPFQIGHSGSTLRFEKKGRIQFDLIPNSDLFDFLVLPVRPPYSVGPVLLNNAKTEQAVMFMDYYAFHQPADRFLQSAYEGLPSKNSWLHSIDLIAMLLMPIGVWVSFEILHHYLPRRELTFSFSTYFLISLLIIAFSFLIMNIPRYIYMYFNTRKS